MIFLLYPIYFALAMLLHELGHLAVARVCRVPAHELGLGWGRALWEFQVGDVHYRLHALPVGAYVRLDMRRLQERPLDQQVFTLLAGIIVNLCAAALTSGSMFSLMNLLLATTNLLPLYQQDGWKCGIVILRRLLRRKSAVVEWTFTLVGGCLSFILFAAFALRYL
jgi:membrane-associated protease RseP (regulator of RpoE activity)